MDAIRCPGRRQPVLGCDNPIFINILFIEIYVIAGDCPKLKLYYFLFFRGVAERRKRGSINLR